MNARLSGSVSAALGAGMARAQGPTYAQPDNASAAMVVATSVYRVFAHGQVVECVGFASRNCERRLDAVWTIDMVRCQRSAADIWGGHISDQRTIARARLLS